MKRGDVVLIKFPFTDLSSSKVRPALVISSDNYNHSNADAIFVAISSRFDNQQQHDVPIVSANPEFSITGLKSPALIRADKIVRLSKSLATRRLGQAGPDTMAKVDTVILGVLGLTRP